jgi:hypothetical protein
MSVSRNYKLTERSISKFIREVTTRLNRGEHRTITIDITKEELKSYPDNDGTILLNVTCMTPYTSLKGEGTWEIEFEKDGEILWETHTSDLMSTLKTMSTPNIKHEIEY